jgi:hypothetical protein
MTIARAGDVRFAALALAFGCGCGESFPSGAKGVPDSGSVTSSGASSSTRSGSPGASSSSSSGSGDVVGDSGMGATSSSSGGGSNAADSGASLADSGAAKGDGAAPVACPAPPSSEPASEIQALSDINAVRALIGSPCATLVAALETSAQKHCDYYAANVNAAPPCSSKSSPHMEVSGCPLFVGADPGARERAAGYTSNAWSEVIAFTGNPDSAVQTWIDSVWHRIPTLSPWRRDIGYGGTTTPVRCDTIDFGLGTVTPNTITAVYPYDGQSGVPTSYNGSLEGPMPPLPATGMWPSGYPVSLFLRGGAVQSHRIAVDGTTTPIDHVWIDSTSPNNGPDDYLLYTNTPLLRNTKYRVQIAATQGSNLLSFDWTFTTGVK